MADTATMRRTPTQARGQQRIDTILDAAEAVLMEGGLDAATTNAIAARANTSIGSLYQFFPNREAVFQAMGLRCLDRCREIFAPVVTEAAIDLPFAVWLDRTIDALDAAQRTNRAFKVLFCSPRVTPEMLAAGDDMMGQFVDGLDAVFAVRRPKLDPARRRLVATIGVKVVEGMMPLLGDTEGPERQRILDEIRTLMHSYLRPIFE